MAEIEQIEQNRDALGNTNTSASKSKQSIQYTYWCFTYNNYEQVEQIEQIFKHECKWYIFQEEIGKEGTPHLQGTICLKSKARLTELKRIDPKIHWEPTKYIKASICYSSKQETSTGKIYSYGIDIPETPEYDEPYGWQLQVIQLLENKPDKRTIHWFWEPKGGVGKTALCRYLVIKYNATILCGKSSDMFHALSKTKHKKVIIIDVPRSTQDFINYGAIEQIKNGLIFSGKYEGCQMIFNHPHVIVFANIPPDVDKMSFDRWNVIRINNNDRPCLIDGL